MAGRRTYILIEEEDFSRLSGYERSLLKHHILNILSSSDSDEHVLVPVRFDGGYVSGLLRIQMDWFLQSFSDAYRQTDLDDYFGEVCPSQPFKSSLVSRNGNAILKDISDNGHECCRVFQFGCDPPECRFSDKYHKIWMDIPWSYLDLREERMASIHTLPNASSQLPMSADLPIGTDDDKEILEGLRLLLIGDFVPFGRHPDSNDLLT